MYDYTKLDAAILEYIKLNNLGSPCACRSLWELTPQPYDRRSNWNPYMEIRKRLRALRNAGKIRFDGPRTGWVILEDATDG